MASTSDFKGLIGPVARNLLGEPNLSASSKTELRFGTHGSLAVDLQHDRYFDHESKEGGGVLDLVARETGHANGEAVVWLREHGYDVGDEPRAERGKSTRRKKIEAVYDYLDEGGDLLFQAVRFVFLGDDGKPAITKDGKVDKTFSQRRKAVPGDDAAKVRDGWVWSVKGVRLVPYRLPDLMDALAEEKPFFIVEGEKKVDRLAAIGVRATCNPMGAKKWPEGFAEMLRGADAIGLPDNDDVGREHMDMVGANLVASGSKFRMLELPGLPPKGDVVDWLDAGGTADELYALVDVAARPWSPDDHPYATRFRALWVREIDKIAPVRDWVLKNILPARGFALVYGDPKCGKSFLTVDFTLTCALAAFKGEDATWFGRRIKPAGVIYIAAEGQDDLKLRIQAWLREHGQPTGIDLPFVLLPTSMDLRAVESVDPLIAEVQAHSKVMRVPRLIVAVDTVSRTMAGGDENSSVDMGKYVENCGKIYEQTEGLVLGVHHKPSGGSKPRGHTSLLGAIDVGIDVIKPEEGGPKSWTVRASKLGREGISEAFNLRVVELGSDADGDAITTCVVIPDDRAPQTSSKKDPRRPDTQEIALQALRNALVDFGEPASAMLGLPPGMRVVLVRHFKTEFLKHAFYDEEPTEAAFRQTVSRVIKSLQARNVIGHSKPYIWIARRDAE